MKALTEKAMLVCLNISQWSARKYDKKVTAKIEKKYHSTKSSNFNKLLLAIEKELKAIQQIGNKARTYFYENTLPWAKNGYALIPNTNYFQLVTKMREFKKEFEAAVELFIAAYPERKIEAQKRLNGLYREEDYPKIALLKGYFVMEVDFMQFPDTTDFRLELDQEEVDELKKEMETTITARIGGANKAIAERIKKSVVRMVEKLKEEKPLFRDSLIENIRELVDILPRLNITGNEDIEQIIQEMRTLCIDPDELRGENNQLTD